MTRQLRTALSLVLVALTALTGCHPTQPFYFHEDGDLSHYLDRATDIEYPDVEQAHLAEVEYSSAPLTYRNTEDLEIWDLTLEETISIGMHNSKVIRNLGGVTQFGFADGLVGRTGSSATVYDASIVETDSQSGVEAALSAFDAQFSMLGSNNGNLVNHTDRPSLFGGGATVTQATGGMRTELSKRSAAGTQYFMRNITEYTRGNTIFAGAQPIESVWQTTMEIEARQPLMRGRGALINRIPVVLARINTDVSLASFEQSVRNFVLDMENSYWDLLLAYRNLQTAKIGFESTQATWQTVNEKYRGGISSLQEEAQAREQFYFFRSQVETAHRDLLNAEGRLRFLLGLAPTDGRLIRPIDEPTSSAIEFDWNAVRNEALIRSPELRQQKWVIERRELEYMAAKNNLLPQFDVGATYRWFGIGDELINADRSGLNFPSRNSTAFDVLTGGDFQEAAFFMQFQMPVGFRRELAAVRNAQLQIARERDRLEDMELNSIHLLTTALRNLEYNLKTAQSQFNRWIASSDEVQTLESLYQGGKGTLDLVLEAQRRRSQAQIEYYRSLTDYNKSIAEVHFRKGSLLEYDNVMLSEGPWPHKAYWDALGLARERDASTYLNYGWTRPGVISQGPVEQQQGTYRADMIDGTLLSPPTVTPTPAEPMETPPAEAVPAPVPDSENKGPITRRPNGPVMNAPEIRAQNSNSTGDRTVQSGPSYEWGNLGLSDSVSSRRNPNNSLRQASHAEPAANR